LFHLITIKKDLLKHKSKKINNQIYRGRILKENGPCAKVPASPFGQGQAGSFHPEAKAPAMGGAASPDDKVGGVHHFQKIPSVS